MVAPTLADGLPSPTIWPREEVPDQVVVTSIPVMMDYLFDLYDWRKPSATSSQDKPSLTIPLLDPW
jgi:hypothetical protein